MNEDKFIVDETEEAPDVSKPVVTDAALQITDLNDKQQMPIQYVVDEHDIDTAKTVCKDFVGSIVQAKLPDVIKKRPELMKIVELHESFEKFTMTSMFAIVAQGMRLLSQLTLENDIYTMEGIIDPFKLQSVLAVQQQCMNLLLQFNTHLRRLPSVISDLLRDLEYSQTIQIEVAATNQALSDRGNVTSKPISILMREAQKELDEQTYEEIDESVPTDEEPVDPYNNIDYNNHEDIDLDEATE